MRIGPNCKTPSYPYFQGLYYVNTGPKRSQVAKNWRNPEKFLSPLNGKPPCHLQIVWTYTIVDIKWEPWFKFFVTPNNVLTSFKKFLLPEVPRIQLWSPKTGVLHLPSTITAESPFLAWPGWRSPRHQEILPPTSSPPRSHLATEH